MRQVVLRQLIEHPFTILFLGKKNIKIISPIDKSVTFILVMISS
jgi:hypothetical protein